MNCWKSALAGLLLLALSPLPCPAEISGTQRKALSEIATTIRTAGQLYIAEDYDACGKEIRQAQQQLLELLSEADKEVHAAAEPLRKRLVQAQALLELEGIVLPPLRVPSPVEPMLESMPEPEPEPEPSTPPEPSTMPPGQTVSFVRDVAPMLVSKCGRCHIQARRGNFSLATFQSLMQGPPEGVVVFPGDVLASRLVEVMETGDMPRGGGSVSEEELQRVKDWVAAGASFDGPGPAVPLPAYASQSPSGTDRSEEIQPPQIRQATGDETVSFARDVAPLLLENCSGCHIDAMQSRGGLRMDTFADLMQGGDSGPIVQPNSALDSLLIKKLRGEVGQRMPLGRPALPDEQIELISTWISEGATLDGRGPDQPLRAMAAMAWAAEASDEELSERRAELAAEHWRLVRPDAEAATKTTDDFLIMGDVPPGTFEVIAQATEEASRMARSLVRLPDGSGIRGRITAFAFPRRYDYSEFGRMTEQRELPAEWREHWRYDGVDAYVAIVADAEDEPEEIASRLAGLLVSLRVAALADTPRWLSEGLGRAAWARLAGRGEERVQQWNAQLPTAIEAVKKPDDLMEGRLTPEQADVLAYGLGQFLLDKRNRRGTDRLLRALAEGTELDQAMQTAFGGPPEALIPAYITWQRMQWR